MHQNDFVAKCRLYKQSHFTRSRKMPLNPLLLSIVFRKGRTLHVELRYFKELFRMKEKLSKPGYLKQRMKLNPEAFLELLRFHAKNYYDDKQSVLKWKKYLILAVDGSSCNVPLTRENVAAYGDTAKHGGKERPQIGISCLFDVMNRMVIDLHTATCKFDERAEAIYHVDRAEKVIGEHPCIYIFDRGYPSGVFFLDLMERNRTFVIRLGSTCFKREQRTMISEDEWRDIEFDTPRIGATLRNGKTENAKRMEAAGKIRLRFVKIILDEGNEEYLITNLLSEEASTSEMAKLYHMRWGIESAFDDMKNKLQLENFTGCKPVIMEQDVYATGYLYNILNDIMQDAEKERNDRDKEYKYKMQINKNLAAGVIKEELIRLILESKPDIQEKIMNDIIEEIKQNLLPVREMRQNKRSSGKLASKYSNVRKRSY